MKTVTLYASYLYQKGGFADGDILETAYCDMDLLDNCFRGQHEVLVALVRDKLSPVLPHPVELDRYVGCHNPIRVNEKHEHDGSKEANAECSVTVTYDEIRRYAEMDGAA